LATAGRSKGIATLAFEASASLKVAGSVARKAVSTTALLLQTHPYSVQCVVCCAAPAFPSQIVAFSWGAVLRAILFELAATDRIQHIVTCTVQAEAIHMVAGAGRTVGRAVLFTLAPPD